MGKPVTSRRSQADTCKLEWEMLVQADAQYREDVMSSNEHSFPFAHIVFFTLTDRKETTRSRFIDACHRYLGGHDGQTHFSVGARATEMKRPVSDQDFKIAMHMIFDGKSAYEAYTRHPNHDEFITATAGMSTTRRVFDSYLSEPSSDKC